MVEEALMRLSRRLLRRSAAVSDWAIWRLPRWLIAFLLAVVVADLAAIAFAAAVTTITADNLALFGLLLGCTAVAVELSRKTGEQGGMMKDVHGVWELPVAILLPPLYALIVPIARVALTQLRVRHAPPHRRVYTAAAVGLSYGAASLTFHGLAGPVGLTATAPGALGHDTVWTLLVVLSALIKLVLNKAMIMTAIKGTNPSASLRQTQFAREPIYNDTAEIGIGALVTYGKMKK